DSSFRPEAAQARQAMAGALATLGRGDEAAALLLAAGAAWAEMDAPRREADSLRQLADIHSRPGRTT
ncbi:MAG TPA: hypothetical protein VGQ85_07215, partial [Candidatus Limnocylindrales bacterium]|nr:hypothetical protein [Candidatus Limnocylindrales bacterium]